MILIQDYISNDFEIEFINQNMFRIIHQEDGFLCLIFKNIPRLKGIYGMGIMYDLRRLLNTFYCIFCGLKIISASLVSLRKCRNLSFQKKVFLDIFS